MENVEKNYMEEIIIDFTLCKNRKDLYTELKKKIDLPYFLGENADALWDCLMEFGNPPVRFCIKKAKSESFDVQYPMGLILESFGHFLEEEPESEVIIL